jgi:hypothetical protein
MRGSAVVTGLALTGMLTACSSALAPPDPTGDGGASDASDGSVVTCMRTSDPPCAMPVPSYANAIAPILHAACIRCHAPGTGMALTSLNTYADVDSVTGSILATVLSCDMPPSDQPQLSDADRAALLDWISCGAPDN